MSRTFQGIKNLSCQSKLMYSRLDYWSRICPEGFYKFREPCEHALYKEGDSWSEELSLSGKAVKVAFSFIGTTYNSKSEYEKAEDKFKGKPFLCYVNKTERKTYYLKNPDFVTQVISKLSPPPENPAKKKQSSRNPCPSGDGSTDCSNSIYNNTSNILSPKSPLTGEKMEREGKKLKIKKEKKPKEVNQGSSPSISDEDLDRAKKMHEIWVEATLNTRIESPKLSVKVAIKLANAFKWLCRGSLDWWRRYCRRVVSSQFLAGKITNFALWLVCAIQPKWAEDVKAGKYGVDSSISLTYYDYEKEKREREERHKILMKEKADQEQRLKQIDNAGYSPEEATLRKQILTHLKTDQYHLMFENSLLKRSENQLKVICANSAIYTLFQEAFRSIGINDIDLITQEDENMLNEILALDCSDTERAIRLSLFDTFSDFYASHFREVKIEALPEEIHMVCQDEEAFCSIRHLLRTLSVFKDIFSKFNINLCVA